MAKLTKEQLKKVKEELLKQLESWPESQKEQAKQQINSLNDTELEEFLKKNNLIRETENSEKSNKNSSEITEIKNPNTGNQTSPFRLIIEGKIPSYKIGENKEAIAVLEINPISKGHTLILAKKSVKAEKLSTEIYSLAKEIEEKLQKTFSPKKVEISAGDLFEEGIIQVVPIYNNETVNSPRQKASDEELKNLQNRLLNIIKEKKVVEKIPAKKPPKEVPLKDLPKAPRRIP